MQDPQAVTSAEPARAPRLMPTPEERARETYRQVLYCAQAMRGRQDGGYLSTGERLAGAVANGKFQIVARMGYTVPQALNRIGSTWVAILMSDRFAQEFQP